MNKSKEIIENAMSYIGQHEISGNKGFLDPKFEAEMKEEGWQMGQAWCSLFAKVVFKNVFPEKAAELDKLFSSSAVQTFKNFENAAYPINNLPREGNLVIWQQMKDGVPQWQGHAGIVVELKSTWEFKSVEGNTNEAGGREGVTVAVKERKVLKDVWNGLKVLGFVQV